MTLGGEMINLVGFDVVDDFCELPGIGKVSIMEKKMGTGKMRVSIEMVDAAPVERAGPPDDAVHLVAFGKEELREIRTVLARDACYEGFFHSGHGFILYAI
jgi:hypothetical protein